MCPARHHVKNPTLPKARLHNGVDVVAEAVFSGDPVGVDNEDGEFTIEDFLLDLEGNARPDLPSRIGRVHQEGAALSGGVENTSTGQQRELVNGDEVGPVDEIGRSDRIRTEAQVGDGD